MCLPTDLDKLDNEKKDLIQSDISALHHFYSKHLEFPDQESLVALFAQVRGTESGDTASSFPGPSPVPSTRPGSVSGNRVMASVSTRLLTCRTLFGMALLGDLEQVRVLPVLASSRWVEHRKFTLPLPRVPGRVYENRGLASAWGHGTQRAL